MIKSFNLKIGHSTQAHALLAFLSFSQFCLLTSLGESHQGGEVIEENNDQERTKFRVMVTSVCQK